MKTKHNDKCTTKYNSYFLRKFQKGIENSTKAVFTQICKCVWVYGLIEGSLFKIFYSFQMMVHNDLFIVLNGQIFYFKIFRKRVSQLYWVSCIYRRKTLQTVEHVVQGGYINSFVVNFMLAYERMYLQWNVDEIYVILNSKFKILFFILDFHLI